METLRPVYVRWTEARVGTADWQRHRDFTADPPAVAEAVGWLIGNTAGVVTLALMACDRGSDNPQVKNTVEIAAGSILTISYLALPDVVNEGVKMPGHATVRDSGREPAPDTLGETVAAYAKETRDAVYRLNADSRAALDAELTNLPMGQAARIRHFLGL